MQQRLWSQKLTWQVFLRRCVCCLDRWSRLIAETSPNGAVVHRRAWRHKFPHLKYTHCKRRTHRVVWSGHIRLHHSSLHCGHRGSVTGRSPLQQVCDSCRNGGEHHTRWLESTNQESDMRLLCGEGEGGDKKTFLRMTERWCRITWGGGGGVNLVQVDKYRRMQTKIEITQRLYHSLHMLGVLVRSDQYWKTTGFSSDPYHHFVWAFPPWPNKTTRTRDRRRKRLIKVRAIISLYHSNKE